MKATFLLLLSQTNYSLEQKQLLYAFAKVESSFNFGAIGDRGKAYGAFQFHRDRWKEVSNKKYRSCTNKEQLDAMITAIARYEYSNNGDVEYITWIANCHNVGHGSDKQTKYVKRIKAALKEAKEVIK